MNPIDEKIFRRLLYSFEKSLEETEYNSLDEAFAKYPLIYFYSPNFYLTKGENSPMWQELKLSTSLGQHIYFPTVKIPTLRRLLPFFRFVKLSDNNWRANYVDSKKILTLLPTRKNIINNLLWEL